MTLEIPDEDFEGYIFDCDGTLVDSMPLHYRAWSESFQHHGAPWIWSEDDFYASAGIPDRDIVARLNEQYGASIDPETIHKYKAAWYRPRMNELRPVPAVAEEVRKCLDQGKSVSVASGSDLSLVEPSLDAAGLLDCFEIIVTPADVERGKPAPDMFLLAARKMGVAPGNCLVFEDGLAGIEAANAAGMKSVFVDSRNLADLET